MGRMGPRAKSSPFELARKYASEEGIQPSDRMLDLFARGHEGEARAKKALQLDPYNWEILPCGLRIRPGPGNGLFAARCVIVCVV